MTFKIEFNDLVRIIKAYDYDDSTAQIVADYLDECIDFELDLTHYIWNTLIFNVATFKTKEEALQYIDDDLCCNPEDCTIWEGNFSTYLEW